MKPKEGGEELRLVAVDPGREKCGVAVLDDVDVLSKMIVPTPSVKEKVEALINGYGAELLALGSGTTGKKLKRELEEEFPNFMVEVVDEYRTTEMARKLYWQENPPKGWRRFLPVTLLYPPVPVDDYAAVIIGRKFVEYTRSR